MKGFLKGFKYFTSMFEEKEPEIKIGLPTDVKHVAHIGFDGPSANTPSWMKDFDAAPELSSKLNSGDVKNLSSQEPSRLPFPQPKPNHKTRRNKQLAESNSPCSSPTQKKSDAPKSSRRNRSANNSMDSGAEGSSGRHRPHRNSNPASESPSSDPALAANPKKLRLRKSKEPSGEMASRPRRGGKSNESHVNSALVSGEENKDRNGNPRGSR